MSTLSLGICRGLTHLSFVIWLPSGPGAKRRSRWTGSVQEALAGLLPAAGGAPQVPVLHAVHLPALFALSPRLPARHRETRSAGGRAGDPWRAPCAEGRGASQGSVRSDCARGQALRGPHTWLSRLASVTLGLLSVHSWTCPFGPLPNSGSNNAPAGRRWRAPRFGAAARGLASACGPRESRPRLAKRSAPLFTSQRGDCDGASRRPRTYRCLFCKKTHCQPSHQINNESPLTVKGGGDHGREGTGASPLGGQRAVDCLSGSFSLLFFAFRLRRGVWRFGQSYLRLTVPLGGDDKTV